MRLVNLLASSFACFRDEAVFDDTPVRLLSGAQALVADLWRSLGGEGLGEFDDMDELTAVADWHLPRVLCGFGCVRYSPALQSAVERGQMLPSGAAWEVEIRGGCSLHSLCQRL